MKLFSLLFASLVLSSDVPGEPPVELGRVAWLRNLEEGQKQASAGGKPILLFFQEVPG